MRYLIRVCDFGSTEIVAELAGSHKTNTVLRDIRVKIKFLIGIIQMSVLDKSIQNSTNPQKSKILISWPSAVIKHGNVVKADFTLDFCCCLATQ